ncbi:branched-chain amino acid ABC transporter permease [Bradyrhizobium sp.]|jgi:branched-subunit amino acid ABC-type transport system permease component|uniref:branched-chain amino acid ABC transporter permease n=1 Tax=Bradyrhizobium sp. TaxID=376 RepID=UPI002E092B7A|nr:branched-chain amino acid ABC transporter permease [Bradyrhizobium sp.]
MDSSFLFGQFLGGLTAAMFLFLIASGLSLIFGILRILNFAHGSFYMIGAYLAWQLVHVLGPASGSFWFAVFASALTVALLGALIERFLLRSLYGREELYQLLFTYAVVLVLADATKMIWGTQQLSLSRPASLAGSMTLFGAVIPHYNLLIMLLGPVLAFTIWLVLHRTNMGRMVRAAALDREMLGALGGNVGRIYTLAFAAGSFLAGLAGALVTPIKTVVPGMDVEIIVEAFIVIVIGGLGSLWGTLIGALIYGQFLSFGILIFPRFSIFAVYALMAIILIIRPWGLFGRPLSR